MKRIVVAAVVVAVAGSLSACNVDSTKTASGDKTTTASQADSNSTNKSTKPNSAKSATAKNADAEKPAPKMTLSQKNAVEAAERYIDFSPFSRLGLIRQLSSSAGDGYSKADATYAVDHITVDWNAQAYKAAKNYLDFSSFSRSGLIQQLTSSAGDQYTRAQATYAVNKVGL
jgi:hypothetical protein